MGTVTEATIERAVKRVKDRHLRAIKLNDNQFRVVCVTSRTFDEPHSPHAHRHTGFTYPKRHWHVVTCRRLLDRTIQVQCDAECEGGNYYKDDRGSSACQHAIAVALRLLRNPKEAQAVE